MSKFTAQILLEEPVVFCCLIDRFRYIPDARSDQGKRFELAFLLGIILLGFLKGKTSVEACVCFARNRKRWFRRWFDLSHGIPDATTIGRALAVTKPQDLILAVNQFTRSVDGVVIEKGVSIDGKTVKAISELKKGCRHFISLFSHTTCRILDQEGVVRKENEITATPRLLNRNTLLGTMVTADALLTQRQVTQAIIQAGGDYLLVVKGNHPDLQTILEPTFKDPLTRKTTDIFYESRKTRCIETVITTTNNLDLDDLHNQGWCDIGLVGKLERQGVRVTKRAEQPINETIYFISSRDTLIPKEAYQFLRNHWHIENKLHWQKDVTWREDRQRTKTGHTPSILSYFRSLALQCIRSKYDSVTQAIEQFTEKPSNYLNMLTQLHLV
jgi:predicted transposase YbfD/YdcC